MKHRTFLQRFNIFLTAIVVGLTGIVLSTGTATVTHADSTQEELEDRLNEIASEMDKLDDKISDLEDDIDKEEEYQDSIDEQIETTEEYIRTLTELISEYNSQIEDLEAEIAEREEDIAATEEVIAAEEEEIAYNVDLYSKRIRALYVNQNDSIASILLGSSDFFDMLMRMELITRVAEYNNNLIQTLLDLKESYENDKAELEGKIEDLEYAIDELDQKKSEVESRKAEWESELDALEELYAESKAQIKALEAQQASYEANKDQLEKEQEEIEEEIERIIRENARSEYIGDLELGTFLWPCPGYYTITSGYGSRWGTMHYGIDISGSGIMGADITAANSGYVLTVYNGCTHNYGKSSSCGCGGGFGNYCIIDHGGGYVTLYAHATKITVSEGDYVSTGDVIGTVGSTGYSTGAHLHFEIRVDGERLNPESFNLIKY